MGWKGGCLKLVGLGSESSNSSGVSKYELLNLEMVLKTAWFESTESMYGELEEKLGRGEEVMSEIEMREFSRWRFDG